MGHDKNLSEADSMVFQKINPIVENIHFSFFYEMDKNPCVEKHISPKHLTSNCMTRCLNICVMWC